MIARTALAVFTVVLLLPGLCPAQDGENDLMKKILTEIEAIRKRLDQMERRLDALEGEDMEPALPDFPPFGRAMKPADYSDLKLPVNPTKEQAREYVLAIRQKVRGRSSWSSSDPEPRLLAKVGSDHLDVILEAMDGSTYTPFNSHAVDAVKMLARERHRDAIIERLPVSPDLAKVVFEKRWERHARKALVDELSSGNTQLPLEWIQALVRLKDPKTYPLLLEFLRNCSTPTRFYDEIAAIPDLPANQLDAVVSDLWDRFKHGGSMHEYSRDGVARIAACRGHVDALEHIAGLLNKSGHSTWHVHSGLRSHILSLIPFRGTNKEIMNWLRENRDRLSFDREKKKYMVKIPKKDEGF